MRYLFAITFLVLSIQVQAQQSASYGLFFRDQYIFNPAAAGAKFYPVLALNHRQQWRGIEDAPVTNTLLFHLPVGDKVSVGTTVYNDTRGLLTTNAFDAAFSYRVPIADDNHNIRFGLAAGIGMNSFNSTRLDPAALQDPALAAYLDSQAYLRGQFGILYNLKGFNLGLSLPSLFQSSARNTTSFTEVEFDPIAEYQGFVSVKIPLGEQFDFEPLITYRGFANGSQYEAGAIFHALELIWFGGIYNQDMGARGVFGFTISDRLDLGYSYEMASNQVSGYANATHELQLSIRVGKKKEPKPKKKKEKEPEPEPEPVVVPVEEPVEEEEVIEEELIPADSLPTQISDNSILRPIIEFPQETPVMETRPDKDEEVVRRGKHMLELPEGHYVMVGVFKSLENAQNYSDEIFSQGHHGASFGYLSAKGYYYVWISTENSASEARRVRDQFRRTRSFSKSWYMAVKD